MKKLQYVDQSTIYICVGRFLEYTWRGSHVKIFKRDLWKRKMAYDLNIQLSTAEQKCAGVQEKSLESILGQRVVGEDKLDSPLL